MQSNHIAITSNRVIFAIVLFYLGTSMRCISQVPDSILRMNNLPNAAQLYLVYCSPRNKVCVKREAICYGQCGYQQNADATGYGCSGDISGFVPKGFHYTRWFATRFEDGKKVSGVATKEYDTAGCHNLRGLSK